MEEPRTSVISEEDTPETIAEKQNNSEVTMDRPQAAESAHASAPAGEATTQAESQDQLRLFVTLLTVRVLTKCHALQNCSQEDWVSHTKRLVDQTVEELRVTKGFCQDLKSTKVLCKDVMKDLQKQFCNKPLLESMILLQDPVMDKAIVQTLQTHINEFPAQLPKKDSSRFRLKQVLQVIGFIVGLLCALALIAVI